MLKADELRDANSCLNKANVDEPVFVLRAKDPIAAQAVRLWAAMADQVHEVGKCADAMGIADQMDKWRDNFFASKCEGSTLSLPRIDKFAR